MPACRSRSEPQFARIHVHRCASGLRYRHSATLAATHWLPSLVANVPAWHESIYHAVFVLVIVWALLRGDPRLADELLYVGAAVTAPIPGRSLAALADLPGSWNHSSTGIALDASAIVAAVIPWHLARHAANRAAVVHKDSIWVDRQRGGR